MLLLPGIVLLLRWWWWPQSLGKKKFFLEGIIQFVGLPGSLAGVLGLPEYVCPAPLPDLEYDVYAVPVDCNWFIIIRKVRVNYDPAPAGCDQRVDAGYAAVLVLAYYYSYAGRPAVVWHGSLVNMHIIRILDGLLYAIYAELYRLGAGPQALQHACL